MKLLRLDLIAYGPFRDVQLDLSGGPQGLHLIYGPNEAGKSSALRAILHLLYGIPERTPDAFQHPYEKLRIGARLQHSDGGELEVIRRKARVHPLRGPDDKQVVEKEELARFLGGVDEQLFRTMFGINYESLVQGGQEILQGRGQLGQVLFAAGAGVADLRSVQEGLQKRMEDLFLPSGKIRRINKSLQDLREAQNVVRGQQLSSDEWSRHDAALRAAREGKERLDGEIQQLRRACHRLTRIRDALPAIARRKELLAELREYWDTLVLPEDFGEKWRQAHAELDAARRQAAQARQDLEQIEAALGRLAVPEDLLAQAGRIEDLHRRLGQYQKDMKDRPERVLQRRELEHEAKEILRRLGRPPDLAEAESLRLRADEPVKIQNLGNRHQALVANLENARLLITRLRGQQDALRERLARLPAPPDPSALRQLVRRAEQQGDLEEALAAAQETLRQAEERAAVELARLPLWSGPLEALERLAVPPVETLDRFENALKEGRARGQNLGERLREEEDALRNLDGLVRQLTLQQEVPTEEDLAAARRRREDGWRLVRQAWRDGLAVDQELHAFLADAAAADLGSAYEQTVQQADHVADRLRREADRVARKAELLANRQKHAAQRERLTAQRAELEAQLQRLGQEWAALWQPLGIDALPPQEMRVWLRRQADLARQAEAIRSLRERDERAQAAVAEWTTRLGNCLAAHGEPAAAPGETLALLLERSRRCVERCDATRRQREEIGRQLAERDEEIRDAEARAGRADEELAEWRSAWATAMARLGLEPNAPPAAANTFLSEIVALFQKLHEADGFRRRIEGIERDARAFTADVHALARELMPDLEAPEPQRAVEELNRRLVQGRLAHEKQRGLAERQKQEEERLRRAEATIARQEARLDVLCRQAGCTSYEELPLAEQRSTRKRQVEHDLRQVEEYLRTLSAGAPLDEFVADATAIDADALEQDLARLSERVKELEQRHSTLDQEIGSERAELARMDGSAAAAEAAEAAEHLLAQLQLDVQEYVVLRVAAAVLQAGIERYREKNQGPVLERASRLFARLTAGSFESLQVEYNEKGEAFLLGVRPGTREQVGVAGMSDGSCDQLYLALRLASLTAYLEGHEPLPFVVDDILVNFDDARAAAALQALAELSRQTQVIFFTHHEHLLELAAAHVPAEQLFTHRLPGRGGPRNGLFN